MREKNKQEGTEKREWKEMERKTKGEETSENGVGESRKDHGRVPKQKLKLIWNQCTYSTVVVEFAKPVLGGLIMKGIFKNQGKVILKG